MALASTPVVEPARPTLEAVLMSSGPVGSAPVLNAATEVAIAPAPSTSAPAPAVAATPVPTPNPDEEWQALQPRLDVAWQNGPDQTIHLLDAFLLQAPGYAPGREKLYAALLARGNDLAGQGDMEAAISQLHRAQQLFPDRAEANDLLSALTPEPTPQPAATELEADASTPSDPPPSSDTVAVPLAVVPVRQQPTAVPPVREVQPPPPALPTPTKVPFVP
jgi:hypothetical protein